MIGLVDEVWVLTRSNNRALIEAGASSRDPSLHFIYYDLPAWALRLKRWTRLVTLYAAAWQWGAYRVAKKYNREARFSRVYHVTFSGMLTGSFMGRIGIPLIVGPIGGGERAPARLREGMALSGKLNEFLRDVGIAFQRHNPLASQALANAKSIYVTTPQGLSLVQSKWHAKTIVQLAIGHCIDTPSCKERMAQVLPHFLFAGRLLQWKGVHLAIRAVAEARKLNSALTLTIFGTGPAERWLRRVAKQCGVQDAVEFGGYIPRDELLSSLCKYRGLVFPSLHDSGGLVVLEALSQGLPVLCLDLGGPAIIVNPSCGVVVSTKDKDVNATIDSLAHGLLSLASMPALEYALLSARAITRANELTWTALTENIERSWNKLE